MPRQAIHPQAAHPKWGNMTSGAKHWRVSKPDWYTGSPNSHHVAVHILVVCEALGLTQLPDGAFIHHANGDKLDYRLENLQLFTGSQHTARALVARNRMPKATGWYIGFKACPEVQ